MGNQEELYTETADEAFNTVHCLFVPWKSESTILTAHLIENEMRGDMMLIDKAYAIHALKRELESETDQKMSDIAFTKLANEMGYKISPKHFRRFKYAIELDQMIPQVLRSGLGGHKIDHIKKVEKAYQHYCVEKTNTEKVQFDAAFMAVMSASNTDEVWDFEQTRLELDDRLSEITGVRYNLLRLEVDAILFNHSISAVEFSDQTDFKGEEVQTESAVKQEENNDLKTTEHEEGSQHCNNQNSASEIELDPDKIKLELAEHDKGTQLKILRQKGFELACKIAKSAQIEEVVMPAKCGLGFFMESPSQPLAPDSVSYYNWWLLFGISEQNVNNDSHYPMWAFTDLYNRFGEDQRNQDNSLVHWIGSEPGIAQFMHEFLHQQTLIIDQTFTDVFRLMENCRKIRSTFLANEIWEEHA